jgi:hypothetical protein
MKPFPAVILLLIAAAALAIAACAGDEGPASSGPGGNDKDTCGAVAAQHPDEGFLHVTACSPVAYGTNPPSSGNHYPVWAEYKTYAGPIPAGFLVHDLEHGAVVIGYRCPEGCADEVAEVQAWIDSLPDDPFCFGFRPKIILAPNPDLDTRWAAAAWAWTWKASCPDTASLAAFYREHYGRTVEAGVCGGGVDYSEAGWCPADTTDSGSSLP